MHLQHWLNVRILSHTKIACVQFSFSDFPRGFLSVCFIWSFIGFGYISSDHCQLCHRCPVWASLFPSMNSMVGLTNPQNHFSVYDSRLLELDYNLLIFSAIKYYVFQWLVLSNPYSSSSNKAGPQFILQKRVNIDPKGSIPLISIILCSPVSNESRPAQSDR